MSCRNTAAARSTRAWQKANPDKCREYEAKRAIDGGEKFRQIKRMYGLTREEWETMYAEQEGKCAVCQVREITDTDHSHETGKPRRLLCRSCNSGLGMFYDDPGLLRKAAVYLEEFNGG